MKKIAATLAVLFLAGTNAPQVFSADKAMTSAQLETLLKGGATITLGGKGEGYLGTLVVSKDGTAKGAAKTDQGNEIKIEGIWRIKGDKFCRTWKDMDKDKEVCETWRIRSSNEAEVYVGKKRAGLNSW